MKLSHKKAIFHAIIEKDVESMGFGTIAYTIFINTMGDPVINTLKVSKNKRIKYKNK